VDGVKEGWAKNGRYSDLEDQRLVRKKTRERK
jgi:hypothetical protein